MTTSSTEQLVRDAMLPDPHALEADASAQEAGEALMRPEVRAVLVVDGGKLLGVITRKTLVREVVATGRDPRTTKLRDIAEPPNATIDSTTPLGEAFAGSLLWPIEQANEVVHAYREWTTGLPETVTSTVRLMRFPPAPELPEPLRGRSLVSITLACTGSESEGNAVVAPLRAIAPVCPPNPAVASRYTPSGFSARYSRHSLSMTGVCIHNRYFNAFLYFKPIFSSVFRSSDMLACASCIRSS